MEMLKLPNFVNSEQFGYFLTVWLIKNSSVNL